MKTTEGEPQNLGNQNFKPRLNWGGSHYWAVCLIVLYTLAVVLPVILTVVSRPSSAEPVLVKIGLAFALLGFSLVCMQVLLAGRFKTVDRPFGLDRLTQFHKAMGLLAMLLLVCHPLLLAVGHESWHIFSLETSWQVNLGKAAIALLVLGVLFAVFFSKLKVDYNLWRFSHKAMAVVVILGFLHSLYIGSDIRYVPVRVYWFGIFFAAVLTFVYRNLVVPVWLRRRFQVSDVKRETRNTYTLTFEPNDGKSTPRNPGQFMFWKLIRPGRPSEIHPFTISASPIRTDILQATIKQSGNFTNTIDQTRPGDIGRIEGPFGRFSFVHQNPGKLLFIAGGVGITPIMSMVRCLRDTGDTRPVRLLYGNKTEKDIIFRQELDRLPENFDVTYVLSKADEKWQGETGYITKETIEKYAADILKDAHIYLCGPPVMMNKVINALQALQITARRIHYERFTI